MPHEPRRLTPHGVLIVAVGLALVIALLAAMSGMVEPTTRIAAPRSPDAAPAAVEVASDDPDRSVAENRAEASDATDVLLEERTNRMVHEGAPGEPLTVDPVGVDRGLADRLEVPERPADPVIAASVSVAAASIPVAERGERAAGTTSGAPSFDATGEEATNAVPVALTEPPTQPVFAQSALTEPSAGGGPAAVLNQIPATALDWIATNGWTIDWRQGPGPGRVAEAQYHTRTIVIWYDTNRPDHIWAGAVAHELGHAVSHHHLTPAQKAEWTAMRGLATWAWQPGMANDFAVGEGDFAEAFMHELLGHPIRSAGGPLTPAQRTWISAHTPVG